MKKAFSKHILFLSIVFSAIIFISLTVYKSKHMIVDDDFNNHIARLEHIEDSLSVIEDSLLIEIRCRDSLINIKEKEIRDKKKKIDSLQYLKRIIIERYEEGNHHIDNASNNDLVELLRGF